MSDTRQHTAVFSVVSPTGDVETIIAKEEEEKTARGVGLCKAMQNAGWTALVYGSARVFEVGSSREWHITVGEVPRG